MTYELLYIHSLPETNIHGFAPAFGFFGPINQM